LTIQEALDQFFEKNNLGKDGGLNKNWAWLKLGRFYIPFPNPDSRKKALVLHDIHHIATGYESNWRGEVAIGAWEISTGCGSYSAAWVLDLGAFALGLFLFPKIVYHAFVRGQHTLNLYKNKVDKNAILQMQVSEVQAMLRLDAQTIDEVSANDKLSFIYWSLVALLFSGVCFIGPYVLLGWFIFNRLHP
jgi:hypothetical protein